jgi:hypothetical protein
VLLPTPSATSHSRDSRNLANFPVVVVEWKSSWDFYDLAWATLVLLGAVGNGFGYSLGQIGQQTFEVGSEGAPEVEGAPPEESVEGEFQILPGNRMNGIGANQDPDRSGNHAPTAFQKPPQSQIIRQHEGPEAAFPREREHLRIRWLDLRGDVPKNLPPDRRLNPLKCEVDPGLRQPGRYHAMPAKLFHDQVGEEQRSDSAERR